LWTKFPAQERKVKASWISQERRDFDAQILKLWAQYQCLTFEEQVEFRTADPLAHDLLRRYRIKAIGHNELFVVAEEEETEYVTPHPERCACLGCVYERNR
jgi:hypothetical protein